MTAALRCYPVVDEVSGCCWSSQPLDVLLPTAFFAASAGGGAADRPKSGGHVGITLAGRRVLLVAVAVSHLAADEVQLHGWVLDFFALSPGDLLPVAAISAISVLQPEQQQQQQQQQPGGLKLEVLLLSSVPVALTHSLVRIMRRRLLHCVVAQGCVVAFGAFGSLVRAYIDKSSWGTALCRVSKQTQLVVGVATTSPPAAPGASGACALVGRERELSELRRCALMALLPTEVPRGALVCGPPGVGKTALVLQLQRVLGGKVRFVRLRVGLATVWAPPAAAAAGNEILYIVLIEEADLQQRENPTALIRALGAVENAIAAAGCKCFFIGEARSSLSMGENAVLFGPGGFLETRLELTEAPSESDRLAMAHRLAERMRIPVQAGLARRLSQETPGYLGGDLQLILKMAFTQTRLRAHRDGSPPQLQWRDATVALRNVLPTSLDGLVDDRFVQNLSWQSVAGYDEVKRRLQYLIQWPWLHPEAFQRMGFSKGGLPGVILAGPSGCGKSLIASVLANECRATFIRVRCSEIMSRFLGGAESKVRQLFERARRAAPCILFFDELDSITQARGGSGNSVLDRVLSTLLNEIDGIDASCHGKGVLVLAATNRIDAIDSALLRPGRLEQVVLVPRPSHRDRCAIFELHTQRHHVPLAPNVDLEELAGELYCPPGAGGADIAGVCREAGMCALREDSDAQTLDRRHFVQAIAQRWPRANGNTMINSIVP